MSKIITRLTRNIYQRAVKQQAFQALLPESLIQSPPDEEIVEVPSKTFEKLKKNQELFQEESDLPTYLKGGMKDKMLFQSTLLLIGIGLVMSLETLLKLN